MSTPTAVSPWTAGLKAARDNFWPSVLILVSATALVVSYYHAPVVTTWLNCIGDINRQYPSGFAFWCTAVTAGLIPWCFRMLWPALRPHHPFWDLFHSFFWWAFMGIIVRYFYALQSLCFGAEVFNGRFGSKNKIVERHNIDPGMTTNPGLFSLFMYQGIYKQFYPEPWSCLIFWH